MEAGQPFRLFDAQGDRLIRDRGAIRFTVVFDTLGDAIPGGIVVEERSASYGFAIDCSPFGPYDFDILVAGRESIRVTEVLSADGSLLQTVVRYRFAEQDSNSQTGYTLPLRRSVREAWNWDEDTRTVTGTVLIGTERGGGTYVQDTGLITVALDTDEAVVVHGPHEAFFGDGIDAIQCAALSERSGAGVE